MWHVLKHYYAVVGKCVWVNARLVQISTKHEALFTLQKAMNFNSGNYLFTTDTK